MWLRDDDAVTVTPQFERLLGVGSEIPMASAVIPDLADQSLVDRLNALFSRFLWGK